jgi:hypothetical protein
MFKIVDELRRGGAKQKEKLLLRTHASNVEYFSRVNPSLAELIKTRGTGQFDIRITDDSLDVFDRTTNKPAHTQGDLLSYTSDLGQVQHNAWNDIVMDLHLWRRRVEPVHVKPLRTFIESLVAEQPGLEDRIASGKLCLPPMKGGRHFSGPVVFLGVFTGLHIMHYLNRVAARDVCIIEPNIDSFALSCFFLDYQLLEKRLGYLHLHVGTNPPDVLLDQLFNNCQVTAASWLRVLHAHQSEQFHNILSHLSLRWRQFLEVNFPLGSELLAMTNGMRNFRDSYLFLRHSPRLSSNATIAVVASGPSLDTDIAWLKANQEKVVIFAAISSVRVLRENGIRFDFQCTLDSVIDEGLLEQLHLDFDVPLIAFYKGGPAMLRRFKKVLLLHDNNKANCVQFLRPLSNVVPTSGNLMATVAAVCNPARLVFIGMDLGFRDSKRGHVSGSWHDDNEGLGHKLESRNVKTLQVAANFPESEGQIFSRAYYNAARRAVENTIASLQGRSRVLNLADGARIKGAVPMRSSELQLPDYPEKAKDLAAFEQGFSKATKDIYAVYETPGRRLIEEMTESIMKQVALNGKFNWLDFANALDSAFFEALKKSNKKQWDMRLEMYSMCVKDLLREWYFAMLWAETPESAERLYRKGLIELKKALLSLPWPEELDALLEKDEKVRA